MRAANDLARLHICTVSPEPSPIALKWKDVNEGSVQIVYQLMWFRYLSHMRAAKHQASLYIRTKKPGEPLARDFADCTKKKGCRWRLSPNCLYQFMWFRYLSHIRAAKNQASLHIRTVSPEPLLIALKRRDVDEGSVQIVYTSSCDLGTYRIFEQQKTRRACTFAQSRQSLCWLH